MNKRYGWCGLLLVGLSVALTVFLIRPQLKRAEGVTVSAALGGNDNALAISAPTSHVHLFPG
ncbi:MAG: hypothetical protein H6976_08455 [Gammaproteobacteria bacterium]|nr:hypothetical protein [Gammaproteobacteria bacterium]